MLTAKRLFVRRLLKKPGILDACVCAFYKRKVSLNDLVKKRSSYIDWLLPGNSNSVMSSLLEKFFLINSINFFLLLGRSL